MNLKPEDMTIYDRFRAQRLEGVEAGEVPEWFTTAGYQMFASKYVLEGETVKSTYERIASHAASYLPEDIKDEANHKFFEMMWNGWLALSTPVLANMGTNRGCPVSCSGGYVDDSIYGFYDNQLETAVLTKHGFGTSAYLGAVRGRTSLISSGGHANGVVPVFKDNAQLMRDVSQGSTRRGAWAGYLEIDHPDFHELCDYLLNHPDDLNIGWIITKAFIQRLEDGDEDAIHRWQKALKTKCVTGKGYFFKVDHVNDQNPPMYKEHGLSVKASNLCTEITLHSDADHTFTCVLSSMNAAKFDEWKDTDAVFWATVFLDCVAEDFIKIGENVRGLERAVRFTRRSRALGLGLLGEHTYMQSKSIVFGSPEYFDADAEIFTLLRDEATRASRYMAEKLGEPEWCRGYGMRNTHLLAVAPNTSSALICGSVSQGVEPVVENVYNQNTAAGEMERVNPELLKLAKEKGIWSKKFAKDIIANNGSIQHRDEFTDHEKAVFRTAFEIDQYLIIDAASFRQKLCGPVMQAQSINVFFPADASEYHISQVHKYGMLDPYLKSMYYMRSKAGVTGAKETECEACEG